MNYSRTINRMYNRQKYLSLAMLVVLFVSNQLLYSQASEWIAPESTNALNNPFLANEDAIQEGKGFYKTICIYCHGKLGKGDGVNAAGLSKQPADFTSEKVQRQSDGALFWKISEGNPPMLSFKSALTEEQRWKIISFIRTLGPKVDQKAEAIGAPVAQFEQINKAPEKQKTNTQATIQTAVNRLNNQIGNKPVVTTTTTARVNSPNASNTGVNSQLPPAIASSKMSSNSVFLILIGMTIIILFAMMFTVIFILTTKLRMMADEYQNDINNREDI